MALKFMKKIAATTDGETGDEKPTTPSTKSSAPSESKAAHTGTKFLKKGADAQAALQEAEAQAEARKAMAGSTFRFRMKQGDEKTVTFIDGDLDDHGMLDVPHFQEHTVKVNGNWQNFLCIADEEPCPICEEGTYKSTLCAALTVIDHTSYKIEKGKNEGKTLVNQRRLFVCKRETINRLTKIAGKRGGLSGCTFEISRSTSDNSPAVGDQFDFVKKHEDWAAFRSKYDLKPEDMAVLDYGSELVALTAEEMADLGIGKALGGGVGSEKGVDANKLQDEL